MSLLLASSGDWCAIRGDVILDPDGWRGLGPDAWDELIDFEEYHTRLNQSTVDLKGFI